MQLLTGPAPTARGPRLPPAAVRVAARTVPRAVVAVAGLCLLPVSVVTLAGNRDLQLSLAWASIVAGAGTGYAVDDSAAATLAASPTSLPRRRGLRAVTVVAVLLTGWLVALTVARAGGAHPGLADLGAQLTAAAALSVALAGVAGRRGHAAPGFGSMAGAVLLVVLIGALAWRLTFLPTVAGPHGARWWWVTAAAAAVAARSWRDPA